MPKKKSKLAVLAERIAIARRFIDQQQALLEILRISKQPTRKPRELRGRTSVLFCSFSLTKRDGD
jgi:hypothetical protein